MDEKAPRQPCRHPSLDDECRLCRIERRARNNARDGYSTPSDKESSQ